MNNCTFCKIISGKSPGKILYKDERVTAFQDIHPAAPTHILIVPNIHYNSLNSISTDDEPIIGSMFTVAKNLAKKARIDKSGYRLILNTGPDGGQTIYHLHLHLIGGQPMRYPMG